MSRTVFTAIVGNPNVGKSTLMNRLIGAKISIISHKPQTTRTRIIGIITEGDLQYVFYDTPGYHIPHTKLGEYMQRFIRDAVDGIDVALLLVNPTGSFDENEKKLLEELKRSGTPVILVVNKFDTVSSEESGKLLVESLIKNESFPDVMTISALTGQGLRELKHRISKYAVAGPFMFDEDALTDTPERVIVAELLRERLLVHLSDELPHGIAVIIESFKERPGGDLIDINVSVICEKKSHKGMIIGKEGGMLKKVASEARQNIEDFLGCRVNLKCWVRVREGWRDKESLLREIGFSVR